MPVPKDSGSALDFSSSSSSASSTANVDCSNDDTDSDAVHDNSGAASAPDRDNNIEMPRQPWGGVFSSPSIELVVTM